MTAAARLSLRAAAGNVLALLFVGGLLWGWQVLHDRTVLYTAAQHAVFLVVQ